jgi:hypothetical protein
MERDEIIAGLTRCETKLDQLLSAEKDHEDRIRSVERKQWYFSGVWAVLALAAAKLGLPVPGLST